MGPKFKPPLKRKIATQSQSAHDSDGRATDEPKKAKSSQSDAKAMSTNATEDHALINTNRRGDRYIFGVANGKESAINIKHVAKMSKKFGTVNDKGLEVIKNNNQEVPNVKATQELTRDDTSVPQMHITLNDRLWEDFAAEDEFFDPD